MSIYSKNADIIHRVTGIEFGPINPKEILKLGVCEITNDNLYKESKNGGANLNDLRMGPSQSGDICKTCNKGIFDCPGHFGYITLKEPMYNPVFLKSICQIMNCVCYKCSRILLDNETLNKIKICKKPKDRLACITKSMGNPKILPCPHCKAISVKYSKSLGMCLSKKIPKDDPITSDPINNKVSGKETCNILKEMKDHDIIALGLDPLKSRPEWFLWHVLPIIPPCIRPSIVFGCNLRSEDDLVYKLNEILKKHNDLKKKKETDEHYSISLYWVQLAITTLIDANIKSLPKNHHGQNGRPLKSLKDRIKGKEGHFRNNILGKRVNYSSRTVIGPDPDIEIGEVGIPFEICKILTFPERVTIYNKEKLLKAVRNGPYRYPGANYIDVIEKKSKNSSSLKTLSYRKNEMYTELKVGWIIHRHLINTDYVLFNRQPSLHRMSMMGHKVKPVTGKSLRLNPSVTKPYNADFDGDEMNIFVPQNELSMYELQKIARVEKQIISPQTNSPIIGSIMDNVLASYILTDNEEYMNESCFRNVAVKLPRFNGVIPAPDKISSNGEHLWSGKTLFSYIMPNNKFSYNNKNVVIDNGIIKQGVLDKKLIGSSTGGLVHVLNNDIGSKAAYDFLNNIQVLTNRYMMLRGFSIGYDDIKRTKTLQSTNKNTIKIAKQEVFDFIEQTYNMKTKISKAEFENIIFNKLNKARDDIGSNVMKTINKYNSFFQMINSGSKGNILNISQILGSVGQQNVQWNKKNGRSPLIINNRSLPYFNQYDCSPEARGFVQSSFVDGLDIVEFFFHMQAGREGVIDTACKTADVGYLQRKLIKSLENVKIKYDMTVRNETNRIVQYSYGRRNTDTIKEERIRLHMLHFDINEFNNNYLWKEEQIKSIKVKVRVSIIKSEYIQLRNYRKQLQQRKLYKSDLLCDTINMTRLIQNTINFFKDDVDKQMPHPVYILLELKKLLDYIRLNNIKANSIIKEMNDYNLLITRALISSCLSTKQVLYKHKLTKNMFDSIIKTIYKKFYPSLIAPGSAVGTLSAQSIGEPCTQLSVVYDTKVKLKTNNSYSEPKIGKLIDGYMKRNPELTYKTHITEDGKASYVMPVPKKWNIKVPGINYKTQKIEYKRVTEFSKHPPNGRLVRIRTKSGKTVIATCSHSFVTKRNNKVVTIRGDQLKVNDIVPIFNN